MQLTAVAGNDIPEGMTAGRLATPDGVTLRYAVAQGPGRALGTVCLLQGRGEFIEKYFETVRDLTRRGFHVATFDWRGQGRSQRLCRNPMVGHVGSFDDYDADLAAFMAQVVLPDCPPPYHALAHSVGAHVLIRALATRTWFEKAVLSAPFFDLRPGGFADTAMAAAAGCASVLGCGRLPVPMLGRRLPTAADFATSRLTSDRARFIRLVRILEAAPDLAAPVPSLGWVRAALISCRRLARLDARTLLRCPVLAVAAGSDRVVSSEASRRFARRVPGVALVVIDHARHELLQETDEVREQFLAAFDAFVGVTA